MGVPGGAGEDIHCFIPLWRMCCKSRRLKSEKQAMMLLQWLKEEILKGYDIVDDSAQLFHDNL